jgi:hypothetical protein
MRRLITPLKEWVAHLRLEHVQKCVLIALADHANPDLDCWPSNARLRNWTSLSERAIRTALRALEVQGLVARTECEGLTWRYRIQFRRQGAPAGHAGVGRHEVLPSDGHGPNTTWRGGAAPHISTF